MIMNDKHVTNVYHDDAIGKLTKILLSKVGLPCTDASWSCVVKVKLHALCYL